MVSRSFRLRSDKLCREGSLKEGGQGGTSPQRPSGARKWAADSPPWPIDWGLRVGLGEGKRREAIQKSGEGGRG
eukprot:scaffold299041_cov31-Tisochrysis_lutea.AAC.1